MPKPLLPCLLLAGLVAGIQAAPGAERLRGEASAFLKSYADSPVDWMPWGDAAMARAKTEQKPVFVFVGSFTSELAAAMRKQTFANAKTSDWLNQQFVCVLVDRDERPDVAALYEAYVSNLKQLNGWPLNIWLTPDFQPFEGATYLSPSEDWGAPGFLKLANQAKTAWANEPAACRKRAADSVAQLAPPPGVPAAPVWNLQKTRTRLSAAAAAWAGAFDPDHGGFGDLPRSPEPELIRFMLLQSPTDREDALKTLRAIAASAVRDPLDGGFFRHAADGAWHIPYQQKTLADQARMALAFLDGAQGADLKSFGQCARGALDFALARLANADGTFAAAEDATGEDYLTYYAWTEAEIDAALGPDSAAFKAAHGVVPGGNVPAGDDPSATFTGRNLLLSAALADRAQAADAAKLLAIRDRRRPLMRDPRGSAAAHGLLLSALSRAGVQLAEPRYLKAAHDLLATIEQQFVLAPEGTVRRLEGTTLPGAAEDYAALALGCRDLAQGTHDKEAAAFGTRLLNQLELQYFDPLGHVYFGARQPLAAGFFIRPAGAEDPPSAEALALPARAVHATALAAQLSESLDETSAQAPGDQLLALALFAGEGPTR
jgi:uncharacterized protein YyaL (SSP411 family)